MKFLIIVIVAYFLSRAGQAKAQEVIFQTSLNDFETEILIQEMPLLFNVDEIKFLNDRDIDIRILGVKCEILYAGIKSIGQEGFTVDDNTYYQLEACANYAMEVNDRGGQSWAQ